jgi:hypothetical protein
MHGSVGSALLHKCAKLFLLVLHAYIYAATPTCIEALLRLRGRWTCSHATESSAIATPIDRAAPPALGRVVFLLHTGTPNIEVTCCRRGARLQTTFSR